MGLLAPRRDLAADATAPTEAGRPARAATQRDPYIDNAKAFLIVLVVIGHVIGTVPATGAHTLTTWVYLFHMPAFIFLAGLMTKGADLDGPRVRSLVQNVIAPYAVFQVLMLVFDKWVGHEQVNFGVTRFLLPEWPLWFLAALLIWRLLVPVLRRLRGAVLWAVVVSVLAGTTTALGWAFALNRAAAFLPFFVVGLYVDRRRLVGLTRLPVRIAAVVVLLLGLALAVVWTDHLSFNWLYWNRSYHELGVPLNHAVLVRLGMMVVAAVMTLAVLSLTPRRRLWVTTWGTFSMYPFLLHGFVVRGFRWWSLDARVDTTHELVLLLLACVALTGLLASRPVRALLRPVVQPPVGRLLTEPVAR